MSSLSTADALMEIVMDSDSDGGVVTTGYGYENLVSSVKPPYGFFFSRFASQYTYFYGFGFSKLPNPYLQIQDQLENYHHN